MGSAANQWQVVSETPAAAAATPTSTATPSSSSQWNVVSETPAATAAPVAAGGGLGAFANRFFKGEGDPGWENPEAGGIISGAVKSAGHVLGNILDMVSRPAPDLSDPTRTAAPVNPAAQKHIQDAAQWLKSGSEPGGFWEHVGAIGEQLLEYVGTDGLLKMVGGGAEAARTGSKAADAVEKLKGAQQAVATLQKNPRLAGLVAVGLKASRDAVLMGGQTYAHTEDPTQAAIAGVTGGLLSGGIGAIGEHVANIAPKTVEIGGEEMPALRSQLNEAGRPMDTGARGAPAVARAQQAGAQAVIRNTAQRATAAALQRINEGRPVYGTAEDSTRLLAAPEGAEPFKFTLEGTPAEEGTEGELTSRAKPIPRTHTEVRPGAPTEEARIGAEPEYLSPGGAGVDWAERGGRSWVNRRAPGFMHPGGEVEGAADVATGGGNLETANPMEAEGWLRQLEDLQQTREFSKLPDAQQAAIETQRQQLSEQLGVYYASPYAQRFAPIDIARASGGVRTFGDAATQIEASAKPVYTTLDRVSGGEFNKWKEAAKQAQAIMRRSTSVEAYESAQAKLTEANGAINDIIDANRGAVSNGDYFAAKAAWRDSSRLNELHSVFEGMMNGVTAEESDQGLTRIMTGRAKQLERYLAEGTNREQLEQLIGKDGVSNLKQITLLLSKANTSRSVQDVARNTFSEIYAHARLGGAGGAIGGIAAHALGFPWYEGMIAGATAAGGIRSILRAAATSPRVGQMVEYAARNGINPQVYAPLIARTILEPFQSQEGEE